MYTKWARFRDMRPPKVDSNAYSYHLRVMQKDGFVEKTEKGYWLTPKGLSYVDKVSMEKFEPRIQPKLTNMLVIFNELGQVLLVSKSKQPFINTWMLPYGKVHLEDESFYSAAVREADEKLSIQPEGLLHVGSCFVRAHIAGELISSILANVFKSTLDSSIEVKSDSKWFDIDDLTNYKLAPATIEIVDVVKSNDKLFFKQLDIDW